MSVIREGRQSDADSIALVHYESWRTTYRGLLPDELIESVTLSRRREAWSMMLAGPDPPLVYVAFDEEFGVVGFVAGGGRRGEALPTDGEVYSIYVLETYQRRGIGRQLMNAIWPCFQNRGFHTAGLWVLKSNQSARAFYRSIGGKPGPERIDQRKTGPIEEVAYIWMNLPDVVAGAPS